MTSSSPGARPTSVKTSKTLNNADNTAKPDRFMFPVILSLFVMSLSEGQVHHEPRTILLGRLHEHKTEAHDDHRMCSVEN